MAASSQPAAPMEVDEVVSVRRAGAVVRIASARAEEESVDHVFSVPGHGRNEEPRSASAARARPRPRSGAVASADWTAPADCGFLTIGSVRDGIAEWDGFGTLNEHDRT